MPKVKFFHPRKLGKKRYPKGVCEVPASDCKGWFYEELVKCGDVAEMADVVKPTAVGAEDGLAPIKKGPPKPGEAKLDEEEKSEEQGPQKQAKSEKSGK